jgi:hypothetical protein
VLKPAVFRQKAGENLFLRSRFPFISLCCVTSQLAPRAGHGNFTDCDKMITLNKQAAETDKIAYDFHGGDDHARNFGGIYFNH